MTVEDETAEQASDTQHKASKRDRIRDAIVRTKSKFKRPHDSDDKLSDDVNEFLAAGRTPTSNRPSTAHSLPPHIPPRPLIFAPSEPVSSPPVTSESVVIPKQSPRRIVVPKIDVSRSQRWPDAHEIGATPGGHDDTGLLRPEYQARSQSVSSLSRRKGRARGLSVTFIEAPPVVIGEGGEEAQTPPIAISKARARARSVSPSHIASGYTGAAHRGPAVGRHPPQEPPEILRPRMLLRVQTGMTAKSAENMSGLEREFEMSLGLGPGSTPSSARGTDSPNMTALYAPTPIRPTIPLPHVDELERRKSIAVRDDLHVQYEEGDALR